MYSPTEERLRTFVERIAQAITRDVDVVVKPGDEWMALPYEKPPVLVYKLSDVGVLSDRMYGVTGHEIAELLYTKMPWEYPWDASKKPRAAHLLVNVVNDARIERAFAEQFPGAVSLFDLSHREVWDVRLTKKFAELPIKWRFLFNVDRVLHGMDPLGDERDRESVMGLWRELETAANFYGDLDTEEARVAAQNKCIYWCERPYLKLLDLMRQEKNEKEAERRRLQKKADEIMARRRAEKERAERPPDYVEAPPTEDDEDAAERTGNQSDFEHEAADQDDHMVGGEDGSPGRREKADGPEGPRGEGEGSSGVGEGDSSEGVDPDASGSGGDGSGPERGEDSPEGADDFSDLEDELDLDPEDKLRPTNIVEEMLDEERGTTNKLIKDMRQSWNTRARAAKAIGQKIEREQEEAWASISEQLGLTTEATKGDARAFREIVRQHREDYMVDRAGLWRQIQMLRHHADTVLRDNALETFGGSHRTGRRLKLNSLYRVVTEEEPRIFTRKEIVGGKSYDVCLVCDQSTSMRAKVGPSRDRNWRELEWDEVIGEFVDPKDVRVSKQELVYRAALTFLEAFDGVCGTGVVGFTAFARAAGGPRQIQKARRHGRGRYARWIKQWERAPHDFEGYVFARTYKGLKQDLKHHRMLVPELRYSHGGTPMEHGIAAGHAMLARSEAEVRAMILITDGRPTTPVANTKDAIHRARKSGIEVHGFFIAEKTTRPSEMTGAELEAWTLLSTECDRAVAVMADTQIQAGFYRLLRGIVRRRRVAA